MAFSFMDGPSGDAYTPQEFLTHAFDQPFSVTQSLGASATQGMLDSLGLGTVIKSQTIDQGRQFIPTDDASRVAPENMNDLLTDVSPAIRQETDTEIQQRGDQALNHQQYKASPYYREGIPWSANMTVNRARDLASYWDVKAVREEMAASHPIVSFGGMLAGSALDPINYIPVLGEGAASAAVARLGIIGGRALVSGADAALNQGIAGLLTAGTRAQFGDDVSWQSQVSQMAIGAAIGAGFGTIGGIFHARANARAEAIRTEIQDRFATIREGQMAQANLREAVASLANDGVVDLSDNAIAHVNDLAGRVQAELPSVYANRVLSETMPDDLRRLAELDTAIAGNTNELSTLRAESMDNERFSATRAAFIQAKQFDEQYERLAAAAEKANSDKQRTQLQSQMEAVQKKVKAIFEKIDPETVDRLQYLDQAIPLREKALADARLAREPIAGKIETARKDIQDRYLRGDFSPEPVAASESLRPIKDFERTPETEALAKNLETPAAQWAPESKARNDAGELVPVYHGTFSRFEKFDSEKLGKETEAGSAREGFFFTENKDVAAGYAIDDPYQNGLLGILNKLTLGGYKKLNEAVTKMFGKSGVTEGRIVTAHLDAKNPLIVEYGGREINEKEVADILRKAKADGHDAVQFKQISDPGYTDASAAVADNWVVFSPDQIKVVDHGDAGLNARAEQGRKMDAQRESLIQRYQEEGARSQEASAGPGTVSSAQVPLSRDNIAMKPAQERTSPQALQAAKSVGKPAKPEEIAEANGVNPETGEFREQAWLDQLEKEGRLTEADRVAMQTANDNLETAKSWGEALRAAVACLI
ncbi:ADP-ribosyltransferase-containing protein [Labrys neptuniae]